LLGRRAGCTTSCWRVRLIGKNLKYILRYTICTSDPRLPMPATLAIGRNDLDFPRFPLGSPSKYLPTITTTCGKSTYATHTSQPYPPKIQKGKRQRPPSLRFSVPRQPFYSCVAFPAHPLRHSTRSFPAVVVLTQSRRSWRPKTGSERAHA
jgi:hypothetical protein